MILSPTWITPASFLFTATELTSTSTSVISSGTGVTYHVISGKLPAGLALTTTGTIFGTPSAVVNLTSSTFVIRAKNEGGVSDRTFYIDIEGADDPYWSTPQGYLNLGYNAEKYVLNKQYIDYQLSALPDQAPANIQLKYFIADGDGKLPPGLRLDQNGILSGTVNDLLSVVGEGSDIGGYDDESYDQFSYDSTDDDGVVQITGVPKIYQFRITATDGVRNTKRNFKILVVNPDTFRADTIIVNPEQEILNPTLLFDSISYLQPVQWINGNDLGTIRASNNDNISVTAYDPAPDRGPVIYSLVTGTSISTQLPVGLSLDAGTGYIYGFIPYQPAYTRSYSLSINATKIDTESGSTVTATNTFSLAIKGDIESTIEWITGNNLGTIETGETSELAVVAQHTLSDYSIKYQLISGQMPSGLTLGRDGSIVGSATYGVSGNFSFIIQASDVYELSAIQREFSVTVTVSSKEYTKIYIRPFLSAQKRANYQDFISNEFTFDPRLMYRSFDTNFGVQPTIKVVLEFGIEKINLRDYTVALRENFYRKRFHFGAIKTAIAKDSNGIIIYEVVYVELADDMVNNAGTSVSPVIYTNNDAYHRRLIQGKVSTNFREFTKDEIYYPSSIDNMRRQLELLVLLDQTYIGVNERHQPRFMLTAQQGDYKPAGYLRVVPICYALPGQGSRIVSRIKLSGFDFKLLDFEVDRLIVENSADSPTAKYLLLARQSVSDNIETDDYLYGNDGQVRLENDDSAPLIRE